MNELPRREPVEISVLRTDGKMDTLQRRKPADETTPKQPDTVAGVEDDPSNRVTEIATVAGATAITTIDSGLADRITQGLEEL